jgi:hypothetical protein
VTPARLGMVKPATGATTTFTAASRGGTGRLRATAGQVTASAGLRVNATTIRVSRIGYAPRRTVLRVTAFVVERTGVAAAGVRTAAVVKRDGRSVFSAAKRTDRRGQVTFLVPLRPGCYRTTVTSAAAPGYRWDGRTPRNGICR